MSRLPIIEDLTTEPIPPGSNILVEFDPASLWFNASVTIAAGWIRSGGVLSYNAYDHAPNNVTLQLKRLGLDVEALEKEGRFRIIDWYTFQLGQKSKEKYAASSLKVADLSLLWSRTLISKDSLPTAFPITYTGTGWTDWKVEPNVLRIADDELVILRFNDEKSFIDLWRTRDLPTAPATKSTQILGAVKGAYPEHVYKSMEAPVDCIIDFKLDETTDPARNMFRIRSLRNVGFDGRWHRLKIGDNSEATLEK